MTIIRSDFPTIQDNDGREVCRGCGRVPPHAHEHVMFTGGAVRCVAIPLEGHLPGLVWFHARLKTVADTWVRTWVRLQQVTGASVEYVGPWLLEKANGDTAFPDDCHPKDLPIVREHYHAAKGRPLNRATWTLPGWLADRSPTGQRQAVIVWKGEDGTWGRRGDPDRGERTGAWIEVPADEPIYASEVLARKRAGERWAQTHGAA